MFALFGGARLLAEATATVDSEQSRRRWSMWRVLRRRSPSETGRSIRRRKPPSCISLACRLLQLAEVEHQGQFGIASLDLVQADRVGDVRRPGPRRQRGRRFAPLRQDCRRRGGCRGGLVSYCRLQSSFVTGADFPSGWRACHSRPGCRACLSEEAPKIGGRGQVGHKTR